MSDGSNFLSDFGSDDVVSDLQDESMEMPSGDDEDMFLDDDGMDGENGFEGLEDTELSERLNLEDLDGVEPIDSDMPLDLMDEVNGTGMSVGMLGTVMMATNKFRNLIDKSDDDNKDAAADVAGRFQDSMSSSHSQSSSANLATPGPV